MRHVLPNFCSALVALHCHSGALCCRLQVMKAVSGKFHPIFQWFHFDSMESLPENLPLSADEVDLQVSCHAPQYNMHEHKLSILWSAVWWQLCVPQVLLLILDVNTSVSYVGIVICLTAYSEEGHAETQSWHCRGAATMGRSQCSAGRCSRSWSSCAPSWWAPARWAASSSRTSP